MNAERAWALAPRLIPRGLLPDETHYNQMRTVVALALLNFEEDVEPRDDSAVLEAARPTSAGSPQ